MDVNGFANPNVSSGSICSVNMWKHFQRGLSHSFLHIPKNTTPERVAFFKGVAILVWPKVGYVRLPNDVGPYAQGWNHDQRRLRY